MVLQRGRPNTFWGWAPSGTKVRVSIAGHAGEGIADASGKWSARVSPPPVGGPYTIKVDGPQSQELKDVLVGDVWICSGQSNMEFGIGMVNNAASEIADADRPTIRLAMVPHLVAATPQQVNPFTWSVCSPQSVVANGWDGFSAVGYFFGRELSKRLGVPIGLVQTCWGGTIAEAWTSRPAVEQFGDFGKALETVDTRQKAAEDGKTAGAPAMLSQDDPNLPTVLYNGMISPLEPLAIKGAIWYQGESNAGRAYQYRRLLPTMIEDWRHGFGQGDFPFLIVQLANFMPAKADPGESAWAELREAQAMTASRDKKAGLAVAIDIGDAVDIHPKDKQDVGLRLALAAMHVAYGQHIVYSGPIYKTMRREGATLRLTFDHVGSGLQAKGGALMGFAVAGSDHVFHWATAKIEGKTIIVRAPEVSEPVAARYAWADNPVANLYNAENLPAVPFRTDDWPGVTAANK